MNGVFTSDDAAEVEPADSIEFSSRHAWGWLLAALPAVVPIIIISQYHVSFIWNDAWDVAALLVKSQDQTLQIADFWKPHLEHRMPVPYLVMFILARLTDWNTHAEVLFGYGLVCILSALLAVLLRNTWRSGGEPVSRHGWLAQWFLVNLLIFSPIQAENWVFGFSSCQNFFPIPCIVGAMLIVTLWGVNWPSLLGAAVLIEVAACSQANGLLGWFILLPMIAIRAERKWMILVWIGLAVASIGVYFIGYSAPRVAEQYYVAGWPDRLRFFLAFLGTPLCSNPIPWSGLSIAFGAIFVLLYAVAVAWGMRTWIAKDRVAVGTTLPWLLLGAYAIANAAMGAWGRAGMGIAQAAASRYTTISIGLLICFIGLAPQVARMRAGRWTLRPMVWALGGLLGLGIVLSGVRTKGTYMQLAHERRAGLTHLTFRSVLIEPISGLLITYDPALSKHADVLDRLGMLHPPLIRDPNIRKLIATGWDQPPGVHQSGLVEGGRQLPNGTIEIWGWAVLHEQARLANGVLVTYDNDAGEPILCAIGDVRVAESMQAQSIEQGRPNGIWIASVPLGRISAGKRQLRCWAYDAELQRAYPLSGVALQMGGG